MSMGLRYEGGFRSIAQTLYDVKIFQKGYVGAVTAVAFCDDPLLIEWPEVDKMEPVMSSNATLRLYSDNDRQFIDLYTIEAGSVRMDVYRNGTLYWSGTLDPELYEEPFAYKSDYAVEITFADLAILERVPWERRGFMTLREIINEAVARSGITSGPMVEHISTKMSETGNEKILDALTVNAANFFDEEDEPMSMREVLDETLKPFALRLTQKSGHLYLYDLNAIYGTLTPKPIRWELDDSVLGVDRIYNNVTVTFSPYEKDKLLNGDVDPVSVGGGTTVTTQVYATAPTDEVGFNLTLSDKGEGVKVTKPAKYFKISPVYSGQMEAGVAWTVKTFTGNVVAYRNYLNEPTYNIGNELMSVKDAAYISAIGADRRNYRLKVNLSLLFDVRYNPFEEPQEQNEEGDYERLRNWCNFAYVPMMLTLRDRDGKALCHWENRGVKESNSFVHNDTNCRWVVGESRWGDAWLCWYQGDRKSETGLGGWQINKQIIGYYRGERLPLLYDKMDAAEYVTMPAMAGYLELKIGTGVLCYDYGDKTEWKLRTDIYDKTRWVLYKKPEVTLVKSNGKTIDARDIEHKAWINKKAKESMSIDTTIGTMREPSPVAQGQLYKSGDLTAVNSLYRGGNTDLLERLLIGTVYSNYATRHTTLSGTVAILTDFGIYTDANEPGRYTLLSEEQNLRADESSIVMAQFDEDNYKGVEFDETV